MERDIMHFSLVDCYDLLVVYWQILLNSQVHILTGFRLFVYLFLFFNLSFCLKYISCSNLQTQRARGKFFSWFNICGCLPKPRQVGQEGGKQKGQEIGGQEGQEETKTMRGKKNTVYSRIIKVTYTPEPPKELRVYPTETELKFSICYLSGVKYELNCSSRWLNSVLLIRITV